MRHDRDKGRKNFLRSSSSNNNNNKIHKIAETREKFDDVLK
jgi:hypothetical protein